MAVFKKLKLLLWKNFILKKRKTLITLLEILMPLLFSAIVLYLRFNSMPKRVSTTNYQPVDISLLPVYFNKYPLKNKFQLVYIPSKSETLKAVTEMVEQTFAVDFEVLGFPSVPLFEKYIIKDPRSFYVLVGIVFDHTFNSDSDPLPLVVKYDLRFSYVQRNFVPSLNYLYFQEELEGWCTAFLYPPNPSQEPREFAYADGGNPGYNKEGFLAIQHAVDKAIMWHHDPNATLNMFKNLHVLLQRFPFGPHIKDPFLVILQNEFPLLLMLSFICVELIIINSILLEKEKKLKEYMCMMGLESWLHWVAWFITFFVSVLIVVSVMTILFCAKVNSVAVFTNSNPSLIFIFLMCFATATIFFAFMMSTFFQRAHVGTVIGGIAFFFTYLPYMYITFNYHQRTYVQKIASCLFSNVAMAIGVRFISLFEAEGTGIQWRNIGSVQGDFSFTQVLLMLLLDSLLYCLIAFLAESFFSGKFGIPTSWYFFAKCLFCIKKPVPVMLPLLDIGDPEKPARRDFMQDEPTDQMKAIEIQHLYKVFYRGRSKCIAVKDLSVNLYKGQITVLLGHNGAGKTTVCSILTGLISPSKGQAYVLGCEVSKDLAQVRKSLGWCPQHDILFDNFTVTDHLSFYGQLKGLSRQNCHEEIEEMLPLLGLKDKWNSRCKFLSWGMKRKLSLGIALIAGSKVLILDEPTSGMDSTSRRAIWDILQQQKSDRMILLTTHFMDEADLLGDRVAIMAKGELQCCGSPPFLKQKYDLKLYLLTWNRNRQSWESPLWESLSPLWRKCSYGPVEDFLLKKAKESPEDFDKLYVVAASFEDVNNRTIVKALFNNQAYHSPGLALTLVDNFLFKLLSGANASITTTNYPQPLTAEELSESVLYQGPKGHYLVVNFLFGIAFLSSSFSILTVTEKNIKSKHIQFVSGVSAVAFWLSALLWDLISFLVPTLLLVLVFFWYKEEAFAHPESTPAVVLIMMLYGWAVIPFIYTVSFSFKTPGNACAKLVVMLTFLSIGPLVLVTVTSDKDLGYAELSDSLDYIFLIFPGHCLGMAFSNLYYNFELKKLCNAKNLSDIDCNDVSEGYVVQKNIYAWESLGIGKYLTALAFLGLLYIILIFLIEANTFSILKSRLSGFSRKKKLGTFLNVTEPEDEDVLDETETIKFYLETLLKKNPLIVKDVSKVYKEKVPVLAVNKVSFTVNEKECFGLLGLNGAGKTSIFNMLTGEQPITSGNAFVKGFNVKSDLVKVRQWIGYCPEFDALLNFMTGREILAMYARIRGIPECHIKTYVDQILEDLLMRVYADKLVKTYSGGNKRMLSTGIALIGEPAVIFLDEPSTGMDPVARRLLWDTVAQARESGKAIVITSHSMEECEALCTRLAIMVQGQFKCLGSPQHLKSKFGSGYSLQAKVQREWQQEALTKFKAFVDLTFPGSSLEDEHRGMVQYYLPGHNLSWAKVFGIMEQAKKDYMLEDYSINQVSLEDIFLSFTSTVSSTNRKFRQGQALLDSSLSPSHSEPPSGPSSQPATPPPSPPPSEPVLL
ncbi:ATP-binding cassette sub-family A member 17-like isoform X6 [Peromyscus californicus insignis]|uniref:ATP-binding cassette sub-family A member 17-like isoform X6 n=1 Tax=Peromyscus californicus insignis TaxID=564181 RepID=UPI0022A67399|nr:ATP-binding cassette sub-family A member 17-like isoform X6 [Peromyscus californicus insignis]